MRLIVMFDLPTQTKEDKRQYTKFRKTLIKTGFTMLQYSIYVRFCVNRDAVEKYLLVIKRNVPHSGLVRTVTITERQMTDMQILVGKKTIEEQTTLAEQLTFF